MRITAIFSVPQPEQGPVPLIQQPLIVGRLLVIDFLIELLQFLQLPPDVGLMPSRAWAISSMVRIEAIPSGGGA